MPLLNIWFDRFNVAKIVRMLCHAPNSEIIPYSSVESILVKIGTVINDIPFCRMLHIVNHNEALTASGRFLYFANTFLT
jgi:hypothetical protein